MSVLLWLDCLACKTAQIVRKKENLMKRKLDLTVFDTKLNGRCLLEVAIFDIKLAVAKRYDRNDFVFSSEGKGLLILFFRS